MNDLLCIAVKIIANFMNNWAEFMYTGATRTEPSLTSWKKISSINKIESWVEGKFFQ